MDRLLRAGRPREPAVHHHAREAVGVEAAQALLRLQHFDHGPRRIVHRLVEVGVPADGDEIGVVLLLGQRLDLAPLGRVLRAEAMQALIHVDHLGHPAIPGGHHHLLGLVLAELAPLHQQARRLVLEDVERLVEIAVDPDSDERVLRLDARPLELHVLQHVDGDPHLLVGGFERGEVDLAVALRGVRIAGPQQRALDKHGDVERRAFGEIANVEVAGVAARRHRAVLPGLRARDAYGAWERRQRNLDSRRELCDLAIEVEVEVLDLTVGKLARKLTEHSGHVEVGPVRPRHDFGDMHLQYVTGLRAFDVHRTGQSVRASARIIGAQLLDLLDGRPRHDLVVRMHHRLEHDRVARVDVQHRRLGIVEPAPLCRFHRGRQQMDLAGKPFRGDYAQVFLVRSRSRRKGHRFRRSLGRRRGRHRRRGRLRLLGAGKRNGERQCRNADGDYRSFVLRLHGHR